MHLMARQMHYFSITYDLEMSYCKYSSSHFTGFMTPPRTHRQAVLVPVHGCCLQKAGGELSRTGENSMASHHPP